MINLRLKFQKDDSSNKEFEIVEGELLSDAIKRITEELPKGGSKLEEIFLAVLNGNTIDPTLWDKVSLKKEDNVLIAPNIKDGEAGQIFKTILVIAITIVASVLLTPAAGAPLGAVIGSSLLVAGISIAATLALNALIPPPTMGLGDLGGGGGGAESSQMYSITGQSNQIKRLGPVPKVYGEHRFYPSLASNPYTELAVDPVTKEVIQYLVAIYDFGLGTPQITDIRIGDTPLGTDSFTDYEYRLVDPNNPNPDEDDFDSGLNDTFTLYKGDRTVTQFSIDFSDGTESTQNSDENPNNYDQEIILDFVCPRGLYGYSSGGDLGTRRINLTIEFAEVSSSTWRGYNDLNYVSSYNTVGGSDLTEYYLTPYPIAPNAAGFSDYYQVYGRNKTSNGNYDSTFTSYLENVVVKYAGTKLAVRKPTPTDIWELTVGTKVLWGGRFLGLIQSVEEKANWMEVVLDRPMTYRLDLPVSQWGYRRLNNFPNTITYWQVRNTATITFFRHAVGQGNIIAANTTAVYASFRFRPLTNGQYKIRVRRDSTSGAYTRTIGDDLVWGAITTSFSSNPITTTKRHVFMELRIKGTNQLNGQIQNLSAIVSQPLPVYDPDTLSWTRQSTSNPAWVLCDLLTGEINKKAVDRSRLHMESIIAWAEYCDEIPTPPPGQTFIEPRFSCNFILDYNTTLQELINSICGAAQASLNIIDGKYGVLVDKTRDTPVQIFTPRNSSQFSSNRFYAPRPHALKVKYIDPFKAWEVTEQIVYDNGYDEETATEFDELTSFACTNHEQAWRFGRYMIAQNRLRQETISILVDFENLVCTRGDYVQITQDVMQVGGRPARVKAVSGITVTIDDSIDIIPDISYGYVYRSATGDITTSTLTVVDARNFDVDGLVPAVGDLIVIGEVGSLVLDCIVKTISPNDDLSAQLVLVERANEIFDYESSSTLPEYDPQISQTSSPNIKPPSAVTNLTLVETGWICSDTQSGYEYYADISWDTPSGSIYELFEIWYNNGSGYRSVATTTSKVWSQVLDQERLGNEMGLKVVAVAASGNKLNLVAMPEVTFTTPIKSTPPSNVDNFGISITQQVLQLSWDRISDCDVFRYELRFSPETNDIWEASVPLQVVDRNVNSIAVQARTGIYFIKAIDFAGNKSETATTIVTTIPNLFDLNVIEEIDDSPTFAGSKSQVELLGSALILTQSVFGDVDTVEYYPDGYYTLTQIVDLGEIYTARLQSLVRADGYRYGELMSSWEHLSEVESLSSADTDDWDVTAEYRATTEILSMASWDHLYDVEHLNEGLGQGFTEWRPIPTIGDATARVFQFRVHLKSITANVTPRLFDATIKVDMPDRSESFEDLVSEAVDPTLVTYSNKFAGPDPSPNIQISVQDGESGDYWVIENKNLEGFQIRIFDATDTQVVRTFDCVAKGYGRRHTVTI